MKRLLLLLLPIVLFVVAYLLRNQETKQASLRTHQTPKQHSWRCAPDDVRCFEKYVVHVIDEGLDIFHYPSDPMPAHTVSHTEAQKIAAFMATLQGLRPTHPEWVKEGRYLFYGNCTGCHGPDGKGQKGYFPDLTRRPLEGLQKRR